MSAPDSPRSPLGEPTPLPPAIEARLDEYRRSVATLQLIGGEYDRCETSHEAFQQAEAECDAARAALSTEIGKEIEASRRSDNCPAGYTLLRAEDYSALQDIAGPAQAWAIADAALRAHEAKCPDGYKPARGGYHAAFDRWSKARKPLAAREKETRKAMESAARRSTPSERPQ